MNRRDALHRLGAASLAGLTPLASPAGPDPMPALRAADLLALLLHENDRVIDEALSRQIVDPHEDTCGALPDAYGLPHAGAAAGFVQRAAAAFVSPASRHAGSAEVSAAMQRAIGFLLRVQHDDGTIDLLTTNFHSTPDTGFVVEPLCIACTLLRRPESGAPAALLEAVRSFLLRAGEALTVGGIHTPNHRWVVSMALARLHALFPDERYVRRVDTWLAEGIDIDGDGQFNERSTHIYSPLTDRCLITLARLLDRPELLQPVRKNLEMTLFYLHPNGEVVTEASGRQDQYQIGTLVNYAYPYRFMALHDRNGRFAAAARFIVHRHGPREFLDLLPYALEDPGLLEPLPPDEPLPTDYRRPFPGSNLVRIRRGARDATILGGNATFFTFGKGEAVLQAVRLASAFFGKGQFSSISIETTADGFVLVQELEGPYYQPFPGDALPGDGDWSKMPRARRPRSEVQRLTTRIDIRESDEGFAVVFDIRGTDRVPVAVELAFRPGGRLSGVDTVPNAPGSYLLASGFGRYSSGPDSISFGPGRSDHGWTQVRGALPKLDVECVYVTGFTPFSYELQIS